MQSALAEVEESFGPDRLSLLALDDVGEVIGWIAGAKQYRGHVWELHPLVVHPERRRQGIGRLLVERLEAEVRALGAQTIWLGTDDESFATTLSGKDLYPDPLVEAFKIRNLRGHPFEFYRKLGFAIVGVLPDANGPGKPDIFMAKRVK
jgi:aminoglycoside 6'-N-acetyltransferase I